MGFVGTILNGFVLKTFWMERQSLNTSINTMTWYTLAIKKSFQASSFQYEHSVSSSVHSGYPGEDLYHVLWTRGRTRLLQSTWQRIGKRSRNIPEDDTQTHFVGLCLDNRVNDVNCIKQSFVLFSHIRNKVSYEYTQSIFDQMLQIHFCSEQFAKEHSDCASEIIIQGLISPTWSTSNHRKHHLLLL